MNFEPKRHNMFPLPFRYFSDAFLIILVKTSLLRQFVEGLSSTRSTKSSFKDDLNSTRGNFRNVNISQGISKLNPRYNKVCPSITSSSPYTETSMALQSAALPGLTGIVFLRTLPCTRTSLLPWWSCWRLRQLRRICPGVLAPLATVVFSRMRNTFWLSSSGLVTWG